jgi:hypothetical protein
MSHKPPSIRVHLRPPHSAGRSRPVRAATAWPFTFNEWANHSLLDSTDRILRALAALSLGGPERYVVERRTVTDEGFAALGPSWSEPGSYDPVQHASTGLRPVPDMPFLLSLAGTGALAGARIFTVFDDRRLAEQTFARTLASIEAEEESARARVYLWSCRSRRLSNVPGRIAARRGKLLSAS